jgi:hypothetical protein
MNRHSFYRDVGWFVSWLFLGTRQPFFHGPLSVNGGGIELRVT